MPTIIKNKTYIGTVENPSEHEFELCKDSCLTHCKFTGVSINIKLEDFESNAGAAYSEFENCTITIGCVKFKFEGGTPPEFTFKGCILNNCNVILNGVNLCMRDNKIHMTDIESEDTNSGSIKFI